MVSRVLANLFLHYAFDAWMTREYPGIVFERYADDAIRFAMRWCGWVWQPIGVVRRLGSAHEVGNRTVQKGAVEVGVDFLVVERD